MYFIYLTVSSFKIRGGHGINKVEGREVIVIIASWRLHIIRESKNLSYYPRFPFIQHNLTMTKNKYPIFELSYTISKLVGHQSFLQIKYTFLVLDILLNLYIFQFHWVFTNYLRNITSKSNIFNSIFCILLERVFKSWMRI